MIQKVGKGTILGALLCMGEVQTDREDTAMAAGSETMHSRVGKWQWEQWLLRPHSALSMAWKSSDTGEDLRNGLQGRLAARHGLHAQ